MASNYSAAIARVGSFVRPLVFAVSLVTSGFAQAPTVVRSWGAANHDTEVGNLAAAQVDAYGAKTIVRTTDGRVFARGMFAPTEVVPPAPIGLKYVHVAAGGQPVGILSDGSLTQWGEYGFGAGYIPLPVIPMGLGVASVASGQTFSAALLSDGSIITWGISGYGTLVVPQLAVGLRYREVAVGSGHAVALVSDGTAGSRGRGRRLAEPPPELTPAR